MAFKISAGSLLPLYLSLCVTTKSHVYSRLKIAGKALTLKLVERSKCTKSKTRAVIIINTSIDEKREECEKSDILELIIMSV